MSGKLRGDLLVALSAVFYSLHVVRLGETPTGVLHVNQFSHVRGRAVGWCHLITHVLHQSVGSSRTNSATVR